MKALETCQELPFALERFEEGGVLLHLHTGGCFRLNATAAEICADLLAGEGAEAIATKLAARFEIPRERARADVFATLRALEELPIRKEIEEPLRYDATGPAHRVLVGEEPVLRIHPERAVIELFEPTASAQAIRDAVDGVVPKLLALRGLSTLHASAVREGEKVRAFSGPSGAGKTTTARLFAKRGRELVSEDLVVLRFEAGAPLVVLSAEARARAFSQRAKDAFERDPRAALDFSSLDELATGSTLPLESIWFLDASRREGAEIQLARLDRPDAVAALLGNLFLATMEPSDWQQALATLSKLAGKIEASAATMPAGLEALHAAIGLPVRAGEPSSGNS